MNDFLKKTLYDGGIFFDLTKWVLLVVIIIILVNSFWVSIFIVDGVSMEPTLHDKEIVIYNKAFSRAGKLPERGDQVVVKYPGDPEHKKYVKRVIGMPGETIRVYGNRVYINNKVLKEEYLAYGLEIDQPGEWKLKDKEYFLMGDNRPNSNDSRYFGPVEQRFFMGKATFIFIPRFMSIDPPTYNL